MPGPAQTPQCPLRVGIRGAGMIATVGPGYLPGCLDTGMQPLPSAARARHVLEIMLAAQTAATTGRTVPLMTTFEH
jgi:hypothetical protein